MLICIGTSYSFVVNGSDEGFDENNIVKFAKKAYETMNKNPRTSLTKNELIDWAQKDIFGKDILTINDILSAFTNGEKD